MGIKISELESTSTANANDVFVINQNGKTKKITKQILQNQMKNLELEEELEDLEKEVEILSETIDSELEDGTATGESITVNDSARAKAKLDVGGNTEQKQYEGRNYLPQPEEQSFTNAGVTVKSNSDGSYSIKGTPTASFNVALPIKEVVLPTNAYIHLRNKGTVTYNATCILRENNIDYGSFAFGSLNRIINKATQEETHINQVVFYGNNNLVGTAIDITCQPSVELTNQTTDFEPYVGGQASPSPDFPQAVQVVKGSNTIKVSNKNWFDYENGSINTKGQNQNEAYSIRSKDYINCLINKQFTFSKNTRFSSNLNLMCRCYDENKNFIKSVTGLSANELTRSVTFTDDVFYFRIVQFGNSEYNPRTTNYEIQCELDLTATYYAEHEEQTLTLTLPEGMEMCKIGDYKDGFIKNLDSGKWYKYKAIQKLVLNGSERWSTDSIPEGHPRHSYSKTNYKIDFLTPPNNDTKATALSNVGIVTATETSNGRANGVAMHPNGNIYVDETTYNNLSSVNVVLYGVLVTPVLEEITDTTLISQLDKLYEVITYYGQTNVTCEGDGLSPIFTLNYKKSNRLRLENIENRLAQIEQ